MIFCAQKIYGEHQNRTKIPVLALLMVQREEIYKKGKKKKGIKDPFPDDGFAEKFFDFSFRSFSKKRARFFSQEQQ